MAINLRSRYLERFSEYLLLGKLIPPDHVQYYVNWVRQGHEHAGVPLSGVLSSEAGEAFFSRLSLDHAEWQVKQARHALGLYRHFGLASASDQRCSTGHAYDEYFFRQGLEKDIGHIGNTVRAPKRSLRKKN